MNWSYNLSSSVQICVLLCIQRSSCSIGKQAGASASSRNSSKYQRLGPISSSNISEGLIVSNQHWSNKCSFFLLFTVSLLEYCPLHLLGRVFNCIAWIYLTFSKFEFSVHPIGWSQGWACAWTICWELFINSIKSRQSWNLYRSWGERRRAHDVYIVDQTLEWVEMSLEKI